MQAVVSTKDLDCIPPVQCSGTQHSNTGTWWFMLDILLSLRIDNDSS